MVKQILEQHLYYYKAKPISAYDADTVRMNIDCGFGIWKMNETIRLARIDAWEVKGPTREQGIAARDAVRELLFNSGNYSECFIKTDKDDQGKYGRFIADILLFKKDGTMINVSDWLVAAGHAVYKEYK